MKKKIIEIDGKQVPFKASAAIPRVYRIRFHRDIFMDLQKIAKSVKKSEKRKEDDPDAESDIPIEDLSVFEQISYIMAKHADPENVPEDIMDWLDQFDTFSIYEVLPKIMELWNLNEQTQIQSKKNFNKVAGN